MITSLIGIIGMAPPPGGEQAQGGLFGMFMPMIVIFAIFYFLLIRPQQKQQKKIKEMLDKLEKGDEVITRSGIHGRIAGITETIITLEIADNVRIKINRDQIGLKKGTEITK